MNKRVTIIIEEDLDRKLRFHSTRILGFEEIDEL